MIVLQAHAATKRYGEIPALAGVSFAIAAGETVGLLGPNGAGKSTLLRCLATLDRLDAGSLMVAGTDVATDPAGARARLGYAGQDAAVDKLLTGREFLRFQAGLVHLPRREASERVETLLARFGLREAADRPTEGYSGGMRRRLDLAASLLHRPALLVLDEPSSGLDYEARRVFWDLLRGLRQEGLALLLATHDFEEAEALCDRVVLLAGGRVAADGTPVALRAALGEWVLAAALHEQPREGDHDRLAEIFAALPGRALPPAPRRADFRYAVRGEGDGSRWIDRVADAARARGVELCAVSARRPTLQDAYLAAVAEAAR